MSLNYQASGSRKEKFLVEDDQVIVGQITSLNSPVKAPQIKSAGNQGPFLAVEDLLIYALDTLSPFDAKFISDHMVKRDEQSIADRLNDSEYWKKTIAFKKLPIFMFEVIFIRDGNWTSRSLLLLTAKRLVPLRCKQDACIHEFAIPQAKLMFAPQSSFGINPEELCKFVANNVKKEHLPYLRRNVPSLEEFMETAKIDFRDFNQREIKDKIRNNALPAKPIKNKHVGPLHIDGRGVVTMEAEHEQTLKNIVKAIGKSRWADATQLLLASHENVVDFDAEDVEIFKRIAGYYQRNLDPDKSLGEFTADEDKCIIFLHKIWNKTMQGDALWNHLARHMKGRNAPQVKNRFLRTSQNSKDLTLENINKYSHDFSRPAIFNHNKGHVFSLTIFQKNTEGMDVTSKLQREVRFLVAGTPEEIFMLPCKYTAIRCTHMGMDQQKFTYDPTRPDEQFLTYLKLTFANAMKKAGLITDPEFHFTDLVYTGDSIHQLMATVENERFLVPKEAFMRLNRRQIAVPPAGSPQFVASSTSPQSTAAVLSPQAVSSVKRKLPSAITVTPQKIKPPKVTRGATRGRGRGRGRGKK
eukprot:GFUD01044743.1.p1 GENE.GFUD01044743.1~~GFUD01044743.1.p1  ORF type:complete len:582 (-),score=118.59 GFUD01044743.1:147-1892(-)